MTEVRTVTDYVEDFEEGTNGADLVSLASLPSSGVLTIVNDGDCMFSNEQVHAGSLALKIRNGSINWVDSPESGLWSTASLSMWVRGAFTEEATEWLAGAHLVLLAVNGPQDSIVNLEILVNGGGVSLYVTHYDATLTPTASDSASTTMGSDAWYRLVVVADGTNARAQILNLSGDVLTEASLPWAETIELISESVVTAGGGGASQITYVDDIVLSLADVVVGVASDDMGGVRQSFLRGR